jgi:hypothetical protein
MTILEAKCCFMNRILVYGIFGLLISCTAQEKSSQTADTLAASTTIRATDSADSIETTSTSEKESDDDCVFNNDYKGLTTDWLKELKITEFIWRDDLKQALIPKGLDTVFLQQGGCTHSGFVVELKLTDDQHAITDSAYWITKALELSREYQMDHYEQMIREGRIKKAESGEANLWYEIDDNNIDDNLIFNGIEITQEGRGKRISISQYFN